MEQQFNNNENEFLRALLANPETDANVYAEELERLVNQYPHSGILQALLAHAAEQKNLKRASLYFAPFLLYKLVNTPSALAAVAGDRVIQQSNAPTIVHENAIQPETSHEEDKTGSHDIDDEIYEEIVAIEDIHTAGGGVSHAVEEGASHVVEEEDKLIAENIIETDFFKFEESFGENNDNDNADKSDGGSPDQAQHEVSKYHDDKMPYTFMWWLDKTRREHAGINQPYVKPQTASVDIAPAATDLQQQYLENIFHINTLEELEKKTSSQSPVVEGKRKEDLIIERFIQEEPQIKPQSSDKLDNENKAKKSAEDHDELVTETLAAIYTDQMLYHKAIASYKKLMLKFPEKSRYFADKIEQLEKKIN